MSRASNSIDPEGQSIHSDYAALPSPAFILDISRLKRNLERIREVQDETGVKIILALKGFAMWRVFPLIDEYLSGATASSLHEARLIFEEMGTQAHTYSPAYIPQEWDELQGYCSHITFNSLAQYVLYQERLSDSISAGLRVNPEYSDVETDLYNPASPHSRLGMTRGTLGASLPGGIDGLHVHTLCESSAAATAELIKALETKFGAFLSQLKWVNLGGGHLMTRKGYNLDALKKTLLDFRDRYPHLEVWMEPGSAIAWDTGELVTTVLDIVENHGVKTAILDASFTAHMPDTLEMPYRPSIRNASKEPRQGEPTFQLGGVSCLAGDFLDAYSFPKGLQVGDRLIFEDMMHYTMVKTTTFNGVQHPSIYLVLEDGGVEEVRRFRYEDFKKRLS